MLATNWNALFAFTFCLVIVYLTTKDIANNRGILFAVLFFISLLFVEQIYTFPLIVFLLVFIFNPTSQHNVKTSTTMSLKYSLPLFAGLFIYIIIYIISQKWGFKSLSTGNESLTAFIERNIWLTPQLFVHNLKLLFFPQALSTYQSNLIYLSHSLISPYSIFCLISYLLILVGPIILFSSTKEYPNRSYFLLPYVFLLSLIPFIHITFPVYCLSADRYLYFPSFYLVLALFCATLLFFNSSISLKKQKVIFTVSLLVLFLMSGRTFIRTIDWKDSETLITSSINLKHDPLYKGHLHKVLAANFAQKNNLAQAKIEIEKSLKYLDKALKKYQQLKEKAIKEPLTLLLYGLDYEALLLKTAYLITDIKLNFFNELGSEANLFKSLMEQRSNYASANEYTLFINLLLTNKEIERTKEILEEALNRYPGSSNILNLYIDFLVNYDPTSNELSKLIKRLSSLYPNRTETLYKALRYYSYLNEPVQKAKYAYLIGLRTHDKKSYQLAAQTYLDLNDLKNAKKTLGKLELMKAKDPFTLLLKSRYQFALKDYEEAYKTLQSAYTNSKANLNNEENANVYKGIVTSLANVAIFLNDTENAKKYIDEYSKQ
ncbi:MAG: hypothetical protein HYZ79_07275 [Candidatus Melainabacteria bacterium]|nr:hypothetical protein [Candidatus Melainabacteria bacterium]